MNTSLLVILVLITIVALHDLFQKKHSLLRTFPIIGRFRYWIEALGPPLRQYIITNNSEERPFDRDQRSWIYASAKKENDYFAFGTDNDLELNPNYLIIRHAGFPLSEALPGEPNYDPTYQIPCAKILGGYRKRKHAFRPSSVVNISGMSYGSLSKNAVMAMNKGACLANCLQSTGEGGLAPAHLLGGDLIWQIGTGYFGCRDAQGKFDKEKFLEQIAKYPIRAIEIKLSQGAKPGLGGTLPQAKITAEIAEIRGVSREHDCISPAAHSAFRDVSSMLDFVEELAEATGLPVGIKSAVGEMHFWQQLADQMRQTSRGVDFITIDGGEGGTGAAPLSFTDYVGLPFKIGFSRVYRIFAHAGLAQNIVFIGSGKLGFPQTAAMAFALGCDMVNVGREAMLAIGCLQVMQCHTNRCPTGVATQSKWLMRGLDHELKAARLANYLTVLRKEILHLSRACGLIHPCLFTGQHLEIIDDHFGGRTMCEVFDYQPSWTLPSKQDIAEITAIMANIGRQRHTHQDAPQMQDHPAVVHQAHDTVVPSDQNT